VKYIIGAVLFVTVLLLGHWLFGIHPTFAETLLVTVAASIAAVVEGS